MVFTIFGCFFAEKCLNKFLLASLESLINSKILPCSNPLQEAWSCFQVATCDFVVLKAPVILKLFRKPAMKGPLETIDQ
jgi:hypothetical protein